MEVLRKYGEATTILFPLIDRGQQDFESTPVTFASGDTQVSKDEGAFANTGSNPAHEGNGMYSLALTATEMEAARLSITLIDQTATKEWEDQAVIISTYGNASAEHAFDLDTALTTTTIADAVHDEVYEGTTTLRQFLRLAAGALFGKLSGAETATVTIRNEADSADRIVASVDDSGNRTSVTLTKS